MPLDVVIRILNNQLSSLMWIDEKVCGFTCSVYFGTPFTENFKMMILQNYTLSTQKKKNIFLGMIWKCFNVHVGMRSVLNRTLDRTHYMKN